LQDLQDLFPALSPLSLFDSPNFSPANGGNQILQILQFNFKAWSEHASGQRVEILQILQFSAERATRPVVRVISPILEFSPKSGAHSARQARARAGYI